MTLSKDFKYTIVCLKSLPRTQFGLNTSGHAGFANQNAMDIANVNRETEFGFGGEIHQGPFKGTY